MKCTSCSSSKSCNNKLFLPKTKTDSLITSFHKLQLNDTELNSKKLRNKFYYKNPEFLNESNIQKQLNILLTNITNKNSNNKLPKIMLDEDKKSYDSKKYHLNTDNNPKIFSDEFPKIKVARKSTYFINKNNSNSKYIANKNKSIDFTYRSIFPKYSLFKEKPNYIDNKLNLFYCQNESQYRFLIAKRKKLRGLDMVKDEDADKIKHRVNMIKTKIKFMKDVIDYSYPSFLLSKIQIWKKTLAKTKGEEKLLPQEEQKNEIKNKNIQIANYLKKNFKVFRLKVE